MEGKGLKGWATTL